MNFDGAIHAHSEWKNKLSNYLRKPDQSLNPNEVAMDNKCELGHWIHTDALAYHMDPNYTQLAQSHARFHRAAADVIRRADQGEYVGEDVALGSKSEFSAASSEVVQAIMKMRRTVNA